MNLVPNSGSRSYLSYIFAPEESKKLNNGLKKHDSISKIKTPICFHFEIQGTKICAAGFSENKVKARNFLTNDKSVKLQLSKE